MEVNWPELVIGGTLFFIVGAVFTLFVQPRLEAQLSGRREAKRAAREAQDAELAHEVERLAQNPALFSAYVREGLVRVVGLTILALLFSLAAMLMGILGGIGIFRYLLFAVAMVMAVPAVTICTSMLDRLRGVRANLEAEATNSQRLADGGR